MRAFFKYYFPVIGWCALIFYLSSVPDLKTGTGDWDFLVRKCAHIGEYAVLFLLARRACSIGAGMVASRATSVAGVFAILYAVSDEFHQSFVPTRGPSLRDVGIDSVGVVLAAVAVYWLSLVRRT